MKRNRVYMFFVTGCCVAMAAYSQMVAVPGGVFTMGGETGEEDEAPPHTVTIAPFSIDKYEVSRAMYDSCVTQGACTEPHYDDGACLMWTAGGLRKVVVPHEYRSPDYPVVCVTWHQARQYCNFKGKRLPTEAEWEYAALAGGSAVYAWGNQPPGTSLCAGASQNGPVRPGSYGPNGWGVYDMTGNVWEWTGDRYALDYYHVSEQENPRGPEVGRYRVIRGGGWYSNPGQLRIKNRQWFVPEYGEVSIGIRCVK